MAQRKPKVSTSSADTDTPVEVWVAIEVHQAVKARVASQRQSIASVARFVLDRIAAELPEDSTAPAVRPPLRAYGVDRRRIRFTYPRGAYQNAKDRILASGQSVQGAIEQGLVHYARTGRP
jgi:hypothetical protein